MDQGDGTFRQVDEDEIKKHFKDKKAAMEKDLFQKGEEVKIKNSRFKILSIGKREMHLRLLPK